MKKKFSFRNRLTSSHTNYTILNMTNYKEQPNIIFLTKELNKAITKHFDKRLDSFGLTSHQGHILFYLNRRVNIAHEEVHQKDIEEEFHLSKSTVSELLKRMEKKGLIVKVGNRPLYKLEPSEEGMKIIDEIRKGKEKTINQILNGIDEQDRNKIIELMEIMIENMKEEK